MRPNLTATICVIVEGNGCSLLMFGVEDEVKMVARKEAVMQCVEDVVQRWVSLAGVVILTCRSGKNR